MDVSRNEKAALNIYVECFSVVEMWAKTQRYIKGKTICQKFVCNIKKQILRFN